MTGASCLCTELCSLGHGKGAAGLREVMRRQGQHPLGRAATDRAERLLNPSSASCIGEGASTGGWG